MNIFSHLLSPQIKQHELADFEENGIDEECEMTKFLSNLLEPVSLS
jgi:hypothetical protein